MKHDISVRFTLAVVLSWGLASSFTGLLAGCERRAATIDGGAEENTPVADDAVERLAAPRPRDVEDDPDAPRALPRTGDVQGWIKVRPVEVLPADRLTGLVNRSPADAALGGFRFERLARAGYESPHATADVLLAEAARPEDALGAYSIINAGADCAPREDGSLRASTPAGRDTDTLTLTAWQGTGFVHVTCVVEEPPGEQDCQALLSRTVFGLPLTEQPLLMHAVREIQHEACTLWIVRSAAPLQRQENPRLRQIEPSALDSRLGLHGDVLLSVVAVEQTEGAAPIIIWLAEYAADENAQAAADRYASALQPDSHPLDAVTYLGSPRGRYLIGTWTADQQAAPELVRMLEEVFPES